MAFKMAAKIANLYAKSEISLKTDKDFWKSCQKGSGMDINPPESNLFDPQ